MLFLILSVLCSVLLGFMFKIFPKYGIDSFLAIVFNYFTCVTVGWISSGILPYQSDQISQPWWPYAIFLGLVFITGFTSVSMTVRYFSVTLGQVMQKMSILLSVPFAMLVYRESAGPLKLLGIFFALIAIVLVNWPEQVGSRQKQARSAFIRWVPLITWLLAAAIEVVFIRVQGESYIRAGDPAFIITVFATAGLLGGSFAALSWYRGKRKPEWRDVLAGIALGIPNYGSMYFLLRSLGSGLEGSVVFPLANIGIILLTTIGAVTLFQERLSRIKWIGIGLALAAIFSISA